jgi:glycosyltransferase involved in cell wall biosynthesis
LRDRFVVMHSGNMGLTQRLDLLIAAADDPAWPANAVLALVGDGAARRELERQAGPHVGQRIRFLPYQPRSELSNSLSAADLHVVSMHDNVAGCLCPSKLYGVLAAGRPVLAIGPENTDLHDVVHGKKLGWCCPPGNPQSIALAVAEAAADSVDRDAMGLRARDIATCCFDRKVVTSQFADMLRDVSASFNPDSVNVPVGV